MSFAMRLYFTVLVLQQTIYGGRLLLVIGLVIAMRLSTLFAERFKIHSYKMKTTCTFFIRALLSPPLINNTHAPECLSARFEHRSDVSVRKTRATEGKQLELPRVRTEHARKFFIYRACAFWNTLPADVRGSRTSSMCRKRCRKLTAAR